MIHAWIGKGNRLKKPTQADTSLVLVYLLSSCSLVTNI